MELVHTLLLIIQFGRENGLKDMCLEMLIGKMLMVISIKGDYLRINGMVMVKKLLL